MGGKRLVSVLTYLVVVSGIFAGSALADPLGLSNDNFESATDISALPYREVVSNLAATDQLGEPRACLGIGKTVWYRLTPANDTIVKVRSDGPTDLVVAVYRGSSLATLGTVECGYATNSSYNGVRFAARAGVTHYIQVGGPAGSVRGKELIIEALPGIAGRLTDEGGNPIEEQCVLLFEADSGWWVDDTFTTRADQFDHPLADAVAGSYVLTGSGRFKVQFYSCWDELYEQEWYDNRADFATADVIEVGAGEAVLGVDAGCVPTRRSLETSSTKWEIRSRISASLLTMKTDPSPEALTPMLLGITPCGRGPAISACYSDVIRASLSLTTTTTSRIWRRQT